jgi:hypothetical protein
MAKRVIKECWVASDHSEHDSEELATAHELRLHLHVESEKLDAAIARALAGAGWAPPVVVSITTRLRSSARPLYDALQSYLAAQEEYQAAKEDIPQ